MSLQDDPHTALVGMLRQMGHDMRVPLNTILSTADMLHEGMYDPLTPRQKKAVDRLQRNSQRLLAMLDDFLTTIKANAGDLTLKPERFDPRALVEAAAEKVRPFAADKGLTLRASTGAAVPARLLGDEKAITRALLALLWNAVAYTAAGEVALLAEWTADAAWTVAIRDTGRGITEDERPHLFEPFWRGEERPQIPTASAGLGLPLARALCEAMGGRLMLETTSAEGSTFRLYLPLSRAEDA
ncbi:MAG: HAMP domain-containing histidine kinase [Anaerolineae bacterium]|nr:HAMP domain-containing histidine kinase [Anaerolineae bacterium]NUQ04521.1 HAMP domain-containing histidine kinase [Anaerolineae bacterium]